MASLIQCTINGVAHTLNESLTITELFVELNLKEEGRVVEYNGKILNKLEFNSTTIKHDDNLEIIQFMGGGN